MTDQEIIKALECCANELGCEKCPANPHRGNYGFCTAPLIKSAFDLITRQQAKIEELQGNLKFVRGTVERQQAEIEEFEKLEDKLKAEKADVMYFKRQIKSEAVREFAEKLQTKIDIDLCSAVDCAEYVSDDLPKIIKNLVEEMVGDQK